MPLQNRVQPNGDIIATASRGSFMGNRGILHSDKRELTKKRWTHKAWVTCLLSFKDRRRTVMTPNRYTELFFHDEAVAFAAGHRPCAECRRDDFNRFKDAADISGRIGAFDETLHNARAIPRVFAQRRHRADIATVPDGCFILDATGTSALVFEDALYRYVPAGYACPIRRPRSGDVTVLTPEPLLAALRGGYALDLRLPT